MYLVFDVGGTFIKYALMTIDGNIMEKHKVSTDSCGNNLNGFITLLSGIYQSYKDDNVLEGIALAIPGLWMWRMVSFMKAALCHICIR